MLAENRQHVEQQVAEITCVQRPQSLLIGRIQLSAATTGERLGFGRIDMRRGPAAVLPPVDHPRQLPRRPAFLVEIRRHDQLFEQAQLVVGIEDGEIGLQADQLGVGPQHSRRDRMEGPQPRHPLDRPARNARDPLLHLARRPVGEGHRQNLARPRPPGRDQVRQPRGQRRRLARPRAGQHQHRPVGRQHRLALRRVEAGQIGGFGLGQGRGFGHPREVGARERNGNRGSDRVIRDIPVIHRLGRKDSAWSDSWTGAYCDGDRGSGLGPPEGRETGPKATRDQSSDLRRQAMVMRKRR